MHQPTEQNKSQQPIQTTGNQTNNQTTNRKRKEKTVGSLVDTVCDKKRPAEQKGEAVHQKNKETSQKLTPYMLTLTKPNQQKVKTM